jgi:hypothetical protein
MQTAVTATDTNPYRKIAGQGTDARAKGTDFAPSKSDSMPAIESGLDATLTAAAELDVNWQARIKRDGTKEYYCPFCHGTLEPFSRKTRKSVKNHMDKKHKAQMELAKIEQAPKAAWTPQMRLVSPKRTQADFMTKAQKAGMGIDLDGVQAVPPVPVQPVNKVTAANELRRFRTMRESQAIQMVPTLDDKQLQEVWVQVRFRGKLQLNKTIRKECKRRSLPCEG